MSGLGGSELCCWFSLTQLTTGLKYFEGGITTFLLAKTGLSTDNIPDICLRFTAKPAAFRIAGVSPYFTAQLQDIEITL